MPQWWQATMPIDLGVFALVRVVVRRASRQTRQRQANTSTTTKISKNLTACGPR